MAAAVEQRIQTVISLLCGDTMGRVNLASIRDNPGARYKPPRVGRGDGSGRGNMCGRGMKGQGQRNKMGIRLGFQGGMKPFYLTTPKHGHGNLNRPDYTNISLSRLQYYINVGRLNPSKTITMADLAAAGCASKEGDGVYLYGEGAALFKSKINLEVTYATPGAINCIESRGGSVKTVHFSVNNMHAHLKPEDFVGKLVTRHALPHNKKLAGFMDPERRGYLVEKERAGELRLQSHLLPSYKEFKLPERLRAPLNAGAFRIYDIKRLDYGKRRVSAGKQQRLDYKGTDRFAAKLLTADAILSEDAQQKTTEV